MKISSDTQKVLQLLAQVIVADGHIYDSELEALAECARDINLQDQSGAVLSEDFVRDWFARHTAELSAFRDASNSDVELTRLILSLSDWPDKTAVVNALNKISRADGTMHMEEKLLISIVRAYWQFDGLDISGATIGA